MDKKKPKEVRGLAQGHPVKELALHPVSRFPMVALCLVSRVKIYPRNQGE